MANAAASLLVNRCLHGDPTGTLAYFIRQAQLAGAYAVRLNSVLHIRISSMSSFVILYESLQNSQVTSINPSCSRMFRTSTCGCGAVRSRQRAPAWRPHAQSLSGDAQAKASPRRAWPPPASCAA